MGDAKTILNLIADMYISAHPNFFYREVVYFPPQNKSPYRFPQLGLSDVFVDQVDIKLVEEQTEGPYTDSLACFFFKS